MPKKFLKEQSERISYQEIEFQTPKNPFGKQIGNKAEFRALLSLTNSSFPKDLRQRCLKLFQQFRRREPAIVEFLQHIYNEYFIINSQLYKWMEVTEEALFQSEEVLFQEELFLTGQRIGEAINWTVNVRGLAKLTQIVSELENAKSQLERSILMEFHELPVALRKRFLILFQEYNQTEPWICEHLRTIGIQENAKNFYKSLDQLENAKSQLERWLIIQLSNLKLNDNKNPVQEASSTDNLDDNTEREAEISLDFKEKLSIGGTYLYLYLKKVCNYDLVVALNEQANRVLEKIRETFPSLEDKSSFPLTTPAEVINHLAKKLKINDVKNIKLMKSPAILLIPKKLDFNDALQLMGNQGIQANVNERFNTANPSNNPYIIIMEGTNLLRTRVPWIKPLLRKLLDDFCGDPELEEKITANQKNMGIGGVPPIAYALLQLLAKLCNQPVPDRDDPQNLLDAERLRNIFMRYDNSWPMGTVLANQANPEGNENEIEYQYVGYNEGNGQAPTLDFCTIGRMWLLRLVRTRVCVVSEISI